MLKSSTQPGEVVDTLALNSADSETKNVVLVKCGRVKVMQLTLPEGKSLPEHKAPGEMTVQCLIGEVDFTTMGNTHQLTAGSLLYLPNGELHSLIATADSYLLLTIFGM